eukprot:TRINITY_DN13052_c0_g1_i1.p1 TRINITY_DN13052_c0_g1~~TRINITY_DN13052_c0_g1_i1.p1  ORF type:complete len:297 (+),score=68.52 TRINITY_DN13052_c0_g1_i1:119-1009(+)
MCIRDRYQRRVHGKQMDKEASVVYLEAMEHMRKFKQCLKTLFELNTQACERIRTLEAGSANTPKPQAENLGKKVRAIREEMKIKNREALQKGEQLKTTLRIEDKNQQRKSSNAKINSIASGVKPNKEFQNMDIKIRGEKNYEEEFFVPDFEDCESSIPVKRKCTEPTIKPGMIQKVKASPKDPKKSGKNSDSLDMILNAIEQEADAISKPSLMEQFDKSTDYMEGPRNEKPKQQEVRHCKTQKERRQLKGLRCKECEEYYATFGREAAEELCQNCSRHRANIPETSTPPHFYDIDL